MPEWKETSNGGILTFHGPKGLSERKEKNDAVKWFIRDAVSDVTTNAVIERLINEVLLLLVEDGKSLKELMLAFDVARATIQRDMALLKAHHSLYLKVPLNREFTN